MNVLNVLNVLNAEPVHISFQFFSLAKWPKATYLNIYVFFFTSSVNVYSKRKKGKGKKISEIIVKKFKIG